MMGRKKQKTEAELKLEEIQRHCEVLEGRVHELRDAAWILEHANFKDAAAYLRGLAKAKDEAVSVLMGIITGNDCPF